MNLNNQKVHDFSNKGMIYVIKQTNKSLTLELGKGQRVATLEPFKPVRQYNNPLQEFYRVVPHGDHFPAYGLLTVNIKGATGNFLTLDDGSEKYQGITPTGEELVRWKCINQCYHDNHLYRPGAEILRPAGGDVPHHFERVGE